VAARLISGSLSKIGRVGVKISDDKPFILENAQKYQEISGTVASLRLDCVVGLAARISREKAAALIRTDRAEVNHLPVSSVSHELRGGDILSIRGYGRFVLSEINGYTKKDRIHIILKKYI
jgi:RNA-binding protein YlmH